MRPAPLLISLALASAPALSFAQEAVEAPVPAPETAEASAPQAPPAAVVPQILDFDIEATRTSLARLRQENQRLKLQLQASQQAPAAPAPLLGDDQQWFVTGAAVGVISFILGLLLTRGRRRREWLN
nr:hypothetical protein [Brevundimonas naejangsanensis]